MEWGCSVGVFGIAGAGPILIPSGIGLGRLRCPLMILLRGMVCVIGAGVRVCKTWFW
jgi:hypothetical protein